MTYKNSLRRFCTIALSVSFIVVATANAQTLEDVLSMDVVVHFVDVGIGDAILIELPDEKHEVLIDSGDRKGYNFADYVKEYLDGPIELMVMTHSDYDHWSGFTRLLEDDRVIEEVWDAGYDRGCKFKGKNAGKRKTDQYLKFIEKLKASKNVKKLKRPVPVNPEKPEFELDEVKFWVLHADPNPTKGDCSYMVNDASIVVRMQYKDVVFLFTGDANGKKREDPADVEPAHVEGELLALEKKHPGLLRANVLKVPHHGSETANTSTFIQAVAPMFAVISSSVVKNFQLPKPTVVQRYQRARFDRSRKIEKVLRTNYGEKGFDDRKFGDDHIICGTNGDPSDLVCDYIWNFER